MQAFPGLSPEYLMWRQSMPQVMDWFDRAMELRTGNIEDDVTDDEPGDEFTWNAEKQRFE